MYEVGDKVIYQGADKSAYKKVGVLKSIEEKDGKPQLTVEFEGGETFTAPVDDWSKEFTNAATNAKFKVGDKVKVVGKGLASKGWVGKVAEVRSGGWPYVVKFDGRENGEYAEGEIAIANSCPCTSTNSVVRNAMVANRRVARNAGGAYDFAAQAGKRFKEAYEALAGCAYYLDRLSTLGAPDDVRGNDAKIASWAKDKQRKVRSIMAELDQGRL